LGKGLGTIEIASKYNLSTKTVDTHKEHIKLKLHSNSSQELRRLAIEWTNHPGRENP
jgi:DNA-binding CsgD family transcriptional regulator